MFGSYYSLKGIGNANAIYGPFTMYLGHIFNDT